MAVFFSCHNKSSCGIAMFSLRNFILCLSIVAIVLGVLLNLFIQWICSTPGIIRKPLPKYDYIVVGGGTAGCVVARRLWERTNASVLLIEAGSTPSWMASIPLLAPALQHTSSDWAYKTTSQKYSQKGLLNAQSSWPRGKVVGGSSGINYLLHTWGARSDFDSLGKEWNFDVLQKYFKQSEKVVTGTHVSDKRGQSGPLHVTEFEGSSPLVKAFMEGVQGLGIQIGDLNGDIEDGAMLSQSNIWRGWRVSSYDAYLRPVISSSNIRLLTNTLIIKVVLDERRAVAVVAVNTISGEVFHIEATEEIILSAGVIGSPLILMWSGMGPQKYLEKHNISMMFDLPGVGQNLMDHLNVPLYFHLDSPVSTTTAKVRSLNSVWKYLKEGKGPLSNAGVESIVRLSGASKNDSKMLFMFFNLGSINEKIFTAVSNFDKNYFEETFPDTKNDSKEGFVILTSCSQPISKGHVSLSSSHPLDPPIIEPNYLQQSEDVKCLKRAIKMAAKLGSTKPLRDLGSRLHLPGYHSCSEYKQSLDDEGYLECWIRISAITAYHPVGTCAMGDHSMSVVDSTLRVHNVENLRVVDASVLPRHISGNPNAAVTMIAERAIDFIVHN
ncbi:neither inactivation nor afterpotential protein G-like [Parasteatoda tepidariorum]|uniref:neither inactivation nor afterpotential protein G-like n=1 Tax=Parasteatoda tepidariorum TaxID=114398 RepID=UPI0039BD5F94